MGSQLNQVQQDFAQLHNLLQNIGRKSSSSRGLRPHSPTSSCTQSSLAAAAAAAAAADGSDAGQAKQQQQQQKAHGLSFDGFASMEDSTAYEYAAAAVQVRLEYQCCMLRNMLQGVINTC
jgi:hypothetical protein